MKAPTQSELYKQAKLYDKIICSVDKDNHLANIQSNLTVNGTLIATKDYEVYDDNIKIASEAFIIGWKKNEKAPLTSYPIGGIPNFNSWVADIKEYNKMYIWFIHDIYVHEIIGSKKISSASSNDYGLWCKGCNNYYEYASSNNNDDGTFSCWSCRKYPFYK